MPKKKQKKIKKHVQHKHIIEGKPIRAREKEQIFLNRERLIDFLDDGSVPWD